MFITNIYALLYLQGKENLVKHQKCLYIMTMIVDFIQVIKTLA